MKKRRVIRIKGLRNIYVNSVISFNNSHRVRRGTVVFIYADCKAMSVDYNMYIIKVLAEEVVKV